MAVVTTTPNLTTLTFGGFVLDSKKKSWTSPKISLFRSPEEAWSHYKTRATAQELAQLALVLDRWRALLDAREARHKRSA